MLTDTSRNIRTHEPLHSITPETSLSIEGVGSFPNGENFIHLKNGRWVADNTGPLYSEPYPLGDPETGAGSGKYFLVDCNPDKAWNDASAYGLYLIDSFGNQVEVYSDPKISSWQPRHRQSHSGSGEKEQIQARKLRCAYRSGMRARP